MDGADGASGGDQLDEFGAVTEGPLGPKGAGQGRPKSEGLAVAVEVEDRGRQEQQREQTKSEKGKKSRQREQHPQFPLTGQAHKAWRTGRAEVKDRW